MSTADEERKGEPGVLDPRTEFERDMAKLDADPKLASTTLQEKQRMARITASIRMEAAAAKMRAAENAARRAAKQDKTPVSVEEEMFGPQPSKTMRRKTKKHAVAGHACVPDLALQAEAELARANPTASVPVQSAGEKKMGHRKQAQRNLELLELRRQQIRAVRCDEWVAEMRRRYATHNPNASQAEVRAAVTLEHAHKRITVEDIAREVTLADFVDRSVLTRDQQREAHKTDERRQAELRAKHEEEQRTAEKNLSKEELIEKLLRDKCLHTLQTKWEKLTIGQHEDRRAMRLSSAQQAILQRSIEVHALVDDAVRNGVPLMKDGKTLFVAAAAAATADGDAYTTDEREAKRDEDGDVILARGAPGEPAYIEFNVRHESFMEFSVDWNPFKGANIVGLAELTHRLRHFEKRVIDEERADPANTRGRLSALMESEQMYRDLVREVKGCDWRTQFVMSISVQCDSILACSVAKGSKAERRWAKEIHGVFTHDAATQDNRDYIDSLGPIKKPLLLCHRDKAFCLDGTPIRYGGKVPPYAALAQLTIKTCDKAECAHIGHRGGAPVFCSALCKRKHVEEAHDHTAVARRQRQRKERKARLYKIKLAKLAEAAAHEAAMQDPVQEETDVEAALEVHRERARQEEAAAVADELAQLEIESEADEEIEV